MLCQIRILSGGDGALFTIGGASSDELILDDGVLDFETKPSYSVIVRTTDSALNTYDETLMVNVNDLNETPIDITPDSFSVNENTNTIGGHSLGVLTTTDEDSAETFTYSILAGGDGALFTIGGAGNDELILDDGVLDYETKASFSVNVRVTDSGLNSYDETLAVNINDLNEPPNDIAPDGVNLPDGTNTTDGLSLVTLTTADEDSGETFSYSIQAGADGLMFSIGGGGSDELILDDGVLDEATKNTYSVNLRVTDSGLNTYVETFTVNVTSVNLPPTDITPNSSVVNENTNTNGGLSIGMLASTDPDGGETFTYSILAGGDGALFTIGGASSDELILDDGVLDFETKPSYSVIVRTTDSALNTYDETLTVNVNDLNETPTDITPNSSVVNENTDTNGGLSIGMLASTDPDGGETFTYSILAGGDGGLFTIGGASSDELILDDGVLDYETQASYSVNLRVTDSALNTYDETLTVNVNDLNETPTNVAPNSFAVNENTNTIGGHSLGVLTTTDEDSPEIFTYSILAGGDGALFTIGGAGSDELILDDGVLDFETKSSYSVNVRVTDSALNTHDATLTVNVNDVNEAPRDVLPNGVNLPDGTNTTGGISLATLTTTDPDSVETFSYSIQPGADGAFFTIGGSAIDELIFDDGVLDESTKNTYTVHLRVTDSGLNTYDETFTVIINDLNESPIAVDDTYVIISTSVISTDSGVSSNDTDAEGDQLTVALVTPPSHGTLNLNADGSFTYSPNKGFVGTDVFVYEVNDGVSTPSQATVQLVVPLLAENLPTSPSSPLLSTNDPGTNTSDENPTVDQTPNSPPTIEADGDTEAPLIQTTGSNRRPTSDSTSDRTVNPDVVVSEAQPPIVIEVDRTPGHRNKAMNNPKRVASGALNAATTTTSLPSLPGFAPALFDGFDELQDELGRDQLFHQSIVGSTLAATTSLSVGYVIWLIRGGVLLSSVLSSLPAWRMVDPLPVLGYLDDDDESDQEDDSLETLLSRHNTSDEVKR